MNLNLLNTSVFKPDGLRIAACVIVKNEADGILEWSAYHHLLGFDAIILVDDQSSDKTIAQARKLEQHCEIIVLPYQRGLGDTQMSTYQRICRTYRSEFDWIAFIDADEFIFCPGQTSIRPWLAAQTGAAIVLPWLFFGSSSHVEKPSGLVLEAYTHRAEFDKFPPQKHVKTIVRPGNVTRCLNPHSFEVKGDTLSPDGTPVGWSQTVGILENYDNYQSWRLNHYFTKSQENWNIRLSRGQLGPHTKRTPRQFADYDRNEVKDDSASQMAKAVAALIAEITNHSETN